MKMEMQTKRGPIFIVQKQLFMQEKCFLGALKIQWVQKYKCFLSNVNLKSEKASFTYQNFMFSEIHSYFFSSTFSRFSPYSFKSCNISDAEERDFLSPPLELTAVLPLSLELTEPLALTSEPSSSSTI